MFGFVSNLTAMVRSQDREDTGFTVVDATPSEVTEMTEDLETIQPPDMMHFVSPVTWMHRWKRIITILKMTIMHVWTGQVLVGIEESVE